MLKTVSSITNAIGALNYKGTWNASTNTPALASGVGTKGDYYVVSVAGSTALDGISTWGVGDWATFNGSVWQRVEGGADVEAVNVTFTGTASGPTYETSNAAAGLTISNNDIVADGTDTNIDIDITPKGTGEVNLPKVDIDGGAIDGTPIGSTTKAAGSFNAFDVTPTSKFGMRHIQGQKTGLGVSPTNQTVFSINVPYSGGTAAFFGTILLSGNYAVEQGANQVSQRSALFRIIFSRVGSNASGNTTTVFVIEESGNAYSEIGSAGSSASMDLTASVPAASATTQTVDIQITAVSDAGTASRFQWSALYIGHTDVTFS